MVSGRWASSNRRATLPVGWPHIRRRILARDRYRCRIQLPGVCVGVATDVDHIGADTDHDDSNLRAACTPCHRRRSAEQGGAARRARAAARHRPAEPHPGAIVREAE